MSGLTHRGTVQMTAREKAACRMVASVRDETESSILRQFTVPQLVVEMERLKELLSVDDATVMNLFGGATDG